MLRRIFPVFFAALCIARADISDSSIIPSSGGDEQIYDWKTKDSILKGHAYVSYKGAYLTADEIVYNTQTGLATARGHVELTRGLQRFVADIITYNLKDQTISATNLRLGDGQYYLSGESITGNHDKITLHNATATYQEPSFFNPTLKAKKLEYIAGKDGRISGDFARLGVGPVKPFAVLKFDQKLNEPLLFDLTGRAGYSGALGALFEIGAKVPVASGVKAGGSVAYYTKRGFLIGPAASYNTTMAGENVSGFLRTGYIHDFGEKLTDILGRNISKDRSFIDWKHHQQLGEQTTLFGQASYWRDSEVIRDFRAGDFYPVQQPDTFFEIDHTRENYVLSLFTRLQPNRYYRVQQRLPEIRCDLLPINIGRGVYEKLNASFAVLKEDAVLAGPTVESTRFDTYYGLTRLIAATEDLTITPVAGGRLTHYAQATGGRDQETRFLGEVGFDSALRASGTFAYKNEKWGVDGIRHLVTPRLSYRYIPEARKGRQAFIPAIDDDIFMTYLRPLGLSDQRNVDTLEKTNKFRLGLDNTFQTRDKKYGSRDLLRVNFAADYLPDPEAGTRDLSDLHTELAFTPIRWLELNLYQRVSPQDFTLREINTGFTIRDANVWSLRAYTHFLKSQIHEYIVEGDYRLNESYLLYGRMHYDQRRKRFNERSYGLEQNIAKLWTIRYGVSVFDGNSREDDFGFHIEVRLAGF